MCKKAESDWVKNEKKLTYFVNHSEICIIGESISSIQAFAKYKEKAELFSELNKTKVIITHLSAMENVKKWADEAPKDNRSWKDLNEFFLKLLL